MERRSSETTRRVDGCSLAIAQPFAAFRSSTNWRQLPTVLFNSPEFALFFVIVTGLYFALPHRFRWGMLLAASCWFYMAFVPAYILILVGTILIDYVAGVLIENATGPRRRLFLAVSIVSNVGVLAFFKYFNFLAENILALCNLMAPPSSQFSPLTLNILLPIGLSFHTFQAMSYTIEVFRGRQPAERHLGIFALYVLFYPQLVAGPIERPQNLLPQFRTEHHFDESNFSIGLRRMLWGLTKKVVIADRLAVSVNAVYASPGQQSGFALLVATIFFAFQIYCDFSGYTDIAIGAARVMGFNLMENFRRPYFATTVSEFWRRWHISLSSWFKDYLYLPLGGNRVGPARLCANLMVVFVISGVWHGAKWTYVFWGAWHGLALIMGVLTLGWREQITASPGSVCFSRFINLLRIAYTFLVVGFGWVLFRAESLADAVTVYRRIGTWVVDLVHHPAAAFDVKSLEGLMPKTGTQFCFTVALLVIFVAFEAIQEAAGSRLEFSRWPTVWRWASYELLFLAIVVFGEFNVHEFIYFQF
jgi:alginate O-acetyltransferase complex protein AlgI